MLVIAFGSQQHFLDYDVSCLVFGCDLFLGIIMVFSFFFFFLSEFVLTSGWCPPIED